MDCPQNGTGVLKGLRARHRLLGIDRLCSLIYRYIAVVEGQRPNKPNVSCDQVEVCVKFFLPFGC